MVVRRRATRRAHSVAGPVQDNDGESGEDQRSAHGDGLGEACQQQPDMPPGDGRVAPAEGQRIDQRDYPSKAEQDADDGMPSDLLAGRQREQHDPERGGVGEHTGAACWQALHAEVGKGEEAGELQRADREHYRLVSTTRPRHAAKAGQKDEGS